MKAMILAAGRGTRMSTLHPDLPKPLLKVGAFSLIEHRIRDLQKAGVTEIVINLHHLASKIREALGDGSRYGVTLHYSFESELLETGGGICQALPWLGDHPFIVASGDTLSDYPFQNLVKHELKSLAHFVLVDNPPHHPAGDFSLEHGYVSLTGHPKLNYAGFALLHPTLFSDCKIEPFKLMTFMRTAIEAHQVTGEYYSGRWMNIDTPDRLALANEVWSL